MGKRVNTAVWYEKYQRWQIKVQKNGIRKPFYSSIPGRNGQREANRKADDWLDDNISGTTRKISVLYDEMLEEIKLTTGTENYKQFKSNGENYIKKKIGNVQIGDLTEQHLQTVINYAFSKGLAKKTLSNIRSNIMYFIKYCRKCNATTLFPENLTIPRGAESKEKVILQPDDLKKLFSYDTITIYNKEQKDVYINAYRFAVVTGLRPGELIGLKWNDVKNNKQTKRSFLDIKRSINRLNEFTKGKNDNAQRSFALTPIANEILQEQRQLLVDNSNFSSYVFPARDGGHLSQSTLSKRWAAYRKEHGLSDASLYELRHTFVSITKELPDGLLKELVGHSATMDTQGVYGHYVECEMEKTADLVYKLFKQHIG